MHIHTKKVESTKGNYALCNTHMNIIIKLRHK